ncbi:hypothetical protein [Streptomyces sp. NPDC094149]|uniref:hypothetical protein n=1 Tax=Streptomyces sp. NPDC094149 TaxID=3155079 RepID=UPI0033228D43
MDGADAGRRLVAVEWIVQNTGRTAPKLFGEILQKGRLSGHFTLRAWLYEPNDNGLFAAYNPEVACWRLSRTWAGPGSLSGNRGPP